MEDGEFDWTGRTMSTPVSFHFLVDFFLTLFCSRFSPTTPSPPLAEGDTTQGRRARGPQPGARANHQGLIFWVEGWGIPGIRVYRFTGKLVILEYLFSWQLCHCVNWFDWLSTANTMFVTVFLFGSFLQGFNQHGLEQGRGGGNSGQVECSHYHNS